MLVVNSLGWTCLDSPWLFYALDNQTLKPDILVISSNFRSTIHRCEYIIHLLPQIVHVYLYRNIVKWYQLECSPCCIPGSGTTVLIGYTCRNTWLHEILCPVCYFCGHCKSGSFMSYLLNSIVFIAYAECRFWRH